MYISGNLGSNFGGNFEGRGWEKTHSHLTFYVFSLEV